MGEKKKEKKVMRKVRGIETFIRSWSVKVSVEEEESERERPSNRLKTRLKKCHATLERYRGH